MIQNGQLVCDSCGKEISRITNVTADGWEKMHNLCSACFLALWEKSIQR